MCTTFDTHNHIKPPCQSVVSSSESPVSGELGKLVEATLNAKQAKKDEIEKKRETIFGRLFNCNDFWSFFDTDILLISGDLFSAG